MSYKKFKEDILNSYEMMSPEEVIERLPDDLDGGVKNYLIQSSKREEPFMFAVIVNQIIKEHNIKLKQR